MSSFQVPRELTLQAFGLTYTGTHAGTDLLHKPGYLEIKLGRDRFKTTRTRVDKLLQDGVNEQVCTCVQV